MPLAVQHTIRKAVGSLSYSLPPFTKYAIHRDGLVVFSIKCCIKHRTCPHPSLVMQTLHQNSGLRNEQSSELFEVHFRSYPVSGSFSLSEACPQACLISYAPHGVQIRGRWQI
jgi:hypothetical protein